jgi:hypothetical protein
MMTYSDFSLKVEPCVLAGNGEYPLLVLASPAGMGRDVLRLPWAAAELASILDRLGPAVRCSGSGRDVDAAPLQAGTAAVASGAELEPPQIGQRLLEALLPARLRSLFDRSLGLVGPDHGLRIRLHFDATDPDLTLLASLPWELAFWEDGREYLSLGRHGAVVRSLDVPRPARPLAIPGPLRVLVAKATPEGLPALEVERECRQIEESLGAIAGVEVRILEHASAEALRRRLLEEPFHVLHFLGHGGFDPGSGAGTLALEDGQGRLAPLPGPVAGDLLRDVAALRLVVLNACDTARSSRREGVDPFAGVAAALIMAGLPAVIGMQFPISDQAAVAFADAFYRRLAALGCVDAAMVEGRMAIHLRYGGSLEWATPVLFMQPADGVLFQFAGGAAARLDGVGGRDGAHAGPHAGRELHRHILDVSELVAEKTSGFVGRRWLFDAVDDFLGGPRGYFVLRGDPGIGKTSFLAELSKRPGVVSHFNIRVAPVRRPESFLANVCAQLIERYRLDYTALPPEATQGPHFLSSLLSRISAQLAAGEKLVLVVDALDEADGDAVPVGANTLYLPFLLPQGVYVIASTRRGELHLRIECEQQVLDLEQDSAGNLADVREKIESTVPLPGIQTYIAAQGLDEATFTAEMVGKSQGNFMYLRYVLPEIERGAYRGRAFATLPLGLQNYYEDHWRRLRESDGRSWLDEQLPVLVALTVVREPVSVERMSGYSGVADRRRIRQVLHDWEPFLYTAEVEEEGRRVKLYRLYHESFQDFVAAKDEVAGEHVDLKAAHARIGDVLWRDLIREG